MTYDEILTRVLERHSFGRRPGVNAAGATSLDNLQRAFEDLKSALEKAGAREDDLRTAEDELVQGIGKSIGPPREHSDAITAAVRVAFGLGIRPTGDLQVVRYNFTAVRLTGGQTATVRDRE